MGRDACRRAVRARRLCRHLNGAMMAVMRTPAFFSAVLIALVPLLGPPAQGRQARGASSSAPAIEAVLVAQAEAWNRGDLIAYMRGYWRSPETVFIGADGETRGWQTLLERYRRVYPDPAAMGHLSFDHLRVMPLAADVALSDGRFHWDRGGQRVSGIFTLVWRRFPQGWRIIHEHTTALAHARLN